MTLFAQTALLVLAAGRATRFGRDKLSEPLHGRPLATHLLPTVAPLAFQEKIIVAQGQHWCTDFSAAGFTVLRNPASEQGQSTSLRLALAASTAANLLILLADMPFVSTGHLERLGRAFAEQGGTAVVSAAPNYRGPPSMLPRALLLATPLEGDEGARTVLQSAREVAAPPGEIRDIDHPADLAAAH